MKLKKTDNLYQVNDDFVVINDNSLNMLDYLEENSVDAIVCDPPYELGFMGKKWDSSGIAYNVELWQKALRVLKAGGYLLAFGGSRTYHRVACAIEDAGFEIRDCLMWLYGSGFPKSHNIGLAVDELLGNESKVVGSYDEPDNKDIAKKQGFSKLSFGQVENAERIQYEIKEAQNEWKGWGTALKPAFEPIVMARKPISEKSVAENCLKHRTGGINIDECRVLAKDQKNLSKNWNRKQIECKNAVNIIAQKGIDLNKYDTGFGRFPANVITDGSEEVAMGMPYTKSVAEEKNSKHTFKGNKEAFQYGYKNRVGSGFSDEGSAMRYFYSAKASKKDRDKGLELLESTRRETGCNYQNSDTARMFGAKSVLGKNIHPTVKPVELMQYLVRLVTAKGGVVLDIFNGSGSTGKAVAFENRERNANYKYIGFELTKEYCEISKARIYYGLNQELCDSHTDVKDQIKEHESKGQLSLFGGDE